MRSMPCLSVVACFLFAVELCAAPANSAGTPKTSEGEAARLEKLQTKVAAIKPGTTIREVEVILGADFIERGYCGLGGTGSQRHLFKLRGGLELDVVTKGHPDFDQIAALCLVKPSH